MKAPALALLLTCGTTFLSACGAPAPAACDRSNCTGCCSTDGRCQPGTQVSACGVGGSRCSLCASEGSCVVGACFSSSGSGGGSGGGASQGGGASAGGSTAGGTAGGGSAGGASSRVGCAAAQYTEALPTTANLGGLTYSASMAQPYLLSALDLRWPHGKVIVEGGLANPISTTQPSCVTSFLRDTSSATAVLRQLSTIVHECGHFYDIGLSRGASAAYVLAPALQRTCANGETTARGGRTFARSLIKGDSYYAMRPACGNMSSSACDFYADTYLDGSPTNAAFESGDQGFSSLLEEANQYVNSIGTALAFRDVYQSTRVSERDGILTFMWYLERYLQLARTTYPQAYATLSQDACWREAILTVWDRGWFYLQASAPWAQNLGINDARLRTLVETPSLLAEINSLRTLHCP